LLTHYTSFKHLITYYTITITITNLSSIFFILSHPPQPKNVGYSFGTGSGTMSSVEAASDFVVWYNNWLPLFPEFAGREVILILILILIVLLLFCPISPCFASLFGATTG
jgi:hypothetical protein